MSRNAKPWTQKPLPQFILFVASSVSQIVVVHPDF